MKLKKGTVPTRCWDKNHKSGILVPQQGYLSTHFGVHKVVYDNGTFSWGITHLNTGMALSLDFDSLKQARHAVALLETTPAPFPWEELTLDNLHQIYANSDLVRDIKSQAYKV